MSNVAATIGRMLWPLTNSLTNRSASHLEAWNSTSRL